MPNHSVRRSWQVLAWLGLSLAACLPQPILGQAPTAAVTGVVRDSAARAIDGAQLLATNDRTGYRYTVRSDASGRYWFRGLTPGTYAITARRIGFGEATRAAVRLPVGATVTANFTLTERAVRLHPIEAVGQAPLIETTQSDVSYTLSRDQIARLPEESRAFMDLARLAPGATVAYPSPEPVATTSIGALNSYSVGIQVDGGNMVGAMFNEQSGNIPLLAIQEFEVLTSSYAAEFGQAASGMVNAVTRSGGNTFTAEGFTLYRHRRLNALGTFESTKPAFNRTHAGVAVGGPIVRDRTHGFVAVERKVENLFATVETGQAFPALEGTFEAPFRDNLLFARIDHRFDDRQELTLRYIGDLSTRRTDLGGSTSCGSTVGAAEFGVDIDRTMHSMLGAFRRRIGETGLAESRFHVLRRTEVRDRLTSAPTFIRPSICSGGNFFSWSNRSWRVEAKQDFSFVATGESGTHRVKFGALASWVQMWNLNRNFANGGFVFLADTDALPFLFFRQLDTTESRIGSGQFGVYVQDEWSPASTVTIQLGLRYDVETNATNQGLQSPDAVNLPFLSGSARPADTDNISPRLGVAWDPRGDGGTVVRGGFGVFYNQFILWYSALETLRGRFALVPMPGTTDPSQVALPSAVSPAVFVRGSNVDAPFTRQYSLGVEHLFPGIVTLRLDGVLIEGRNLPILRELQTVPIPRYPQYPVVSQILNRGQADAKMLVVRARKTFDRAMFDVHYTLADRKITNDWWFQPSPQTDPDNEDFSGELGPAGWDERHRVVALAQVDLPLEIRTGLKTVYSSAKPFNAFTGTDDNMDNQQNNDRPPGEGRNARRGPDFFSVDLNITRDFRVGRSQLGLVANVYNLFNRDNFLSTAVVGNLQSPLFGQALGAFAKRQAEVGLRVLY